MLGNYLSAALGNLRRNWTYTGVSVAGLAVGFAAAILIGLFVRDEFSYDRWIPGHEQVYRVSQILIPPGGGRPQSADPTRADIAGLLKLEAPQIQSIARIAPDQPIFRRGDVTAVERDVFWADPATFSVLPLPVIAGDLKTALQRPDGIVLTRRLARKYFGRDAPIGGTLELNPAWGPGPSASDTALFNSPHPMRVMAVLEDLPSNTHLKAEAFASGRAAFSKLSMLDRGPSNPFGQAAYTYMRLRPGASGEAVRAALPGLVARHVPLGPLQGSGFALVLTAIADIHLGPGSNLAMKPVGQKAVIATIAVVGLLIVLTAVINFLTLMTSRAARRAVEVGVRKAVGARRRDLIVQFLGEALIQVAVSMLLAVALTELLLPTLNAFLHRTIQFDYLGAPGVSAAIVGATLGIALLAGLYPATVLSSYRPALALKGEAQTSGSGQLRQGLVVIQFAILIGLIIASATLYRQTAFALNQALRFQGERVLWIKAPCTTLLHERVLSVPGVHAAACSGGPSLSADEGAPTVGSGRDGRTVQLQMAPVGFGLFEFYGVRPLAGRLFAPRYGTDGLLLQPTTTGNPSVILNESAVRALGFASPRRAIEASVDWSRLVMSPMNPPTLLPKLPSRIVGVVPDFSLGSVRTPIQPLLYYVDPSLLFTLSAKIDGRNMPQSLRGLDRLWVAMGNTRPMQRQFLDQATRDLYDDVITQGDVIAACAGLAIFIACLGMFALAAFTTERRTKEIGVRKAMGASTFDVVRLLLWQFTLPVLWATLIAWPAAWWAMNTWLHGFAYRVDLPPWLFLTATAAAVAIAWATVSTHAFLVARAKPVLALRYE